MEKKKPAIAGFLVMGLGGGLGCVAQQILCEDFPLATLLAPVLAHRGGSVFGHVQIHDADLSGIFLPVVDRHVFDRQL